MICYGKGRHEAPRSDTYPTKKTDKSRAGVAGESKAHKEKRESDRRRGIRNRSEGVPRRETVPPRVCIPSLTRISRRTSSKITPSPQIWKTCNRVRIDMKQAFLQFASNTDCCSFMCCRLVWGVKEGARLQKVASPPYENK